MFPLQLGASKPKMLPVPQKNGAGFLGGARTKIPVGSVSDAPYTCMHAACAFAVVQRGWFEERRGGTGGHHANPRRGWWDATAPDTDVERWRNAATADPDRELAPGCTEQNRVWFSAKG